MQGIYDIMHWLKICPEMINFLFFCPEKNLSKFLKNLPKKIKIFPLTEPANKSSESDIIFASLYYIVNIVFASLYYSVTLP